MHLLAIRDIPVEVVVTHRDDRESLLPRPGLEQTRLLMPACGFTIFCDLLEQRRPDLILVFREGLSRRSSSALTREVTIMTDSCGTVARSPFSV